MEKINIQSEILKDNWKLIEETFKQSKIIYDKCYKKNASDNDWKYEKLFEFLSHKWKELYSEFVLLPYENEILSLFYKIQTKSFEKEKNIKGEVTKFNVFYYLSQYFYIFVLPNLNGNYEYEDYPRFEIKTNDQNRELYGIFEELWYELNESNGGYKDSEFDEYDDLPLDVFNEIEFNLFSSFLSEKWNETKAKTNSNVIATLSESTGIGENYHLDENRKLSDEELDIILEG